MKADSNANGAGVNGASNGARAAVDAPFAPCLPGETGGHGANGASRPGRGGSAMAQLRAMAQPAMAQHATGLSGTEIIARLEEAGSTLLALPASGYSTRMRTGKFDIVRSALEAYGADKGAERLRPAVPPSAAITRMDEAMGWLALLPQDRYVLRRIVGARSLISPATGRHLFTWRRLATLLGADHKAIQRWHAQGIAMIARALATRRSAPVRQARI